MSIVDGLHRASQQLLQSPAETMLGEFAGHCRNVRRLLHFTYRSVVFEGGCAEDALRRVLYLPSPATVTCMVFRIVTPVVTPVAESCE
jgi:hypothetical protein